MKTMSQVNKLESLSNLVSLWSHEHSPAAEGSSLDNPRIKRAIETIVQELTAPKPQPTISKGKTYLNLKEGKIIKAGAPLEFLEGYLKAIDKRDREFRGETVKYWYVDIEPLEGDELYSLAIPYYSGAAKSLFNSLASAEDFTQPVKIETYLSSGYTKVKVSQGAERLSWKAPELPPIEQIKLGDRVVKDESKRMEFIVNLVNLITSKI
jgi:hypothetical protein